MDSEPSDVRNRFVRLSSNSDSFINIRDLATRAETRVDLIQGVWLTRRVDLLAEE